LYSKRIISRINAPRTLQIKIMSIKYSEKPASKTGSAWPT
jgi:hypothetical protein